MENANEDGNKDITSKVEKWFAELDKFKAVPFSFDRKQPASLESRLFKESDGE
jgi:hypothetical protein